MTGKNERKERKKKERKKGKRETAVHGDYA